MPGKNKMIVGAAVLFAGLLCIGIGCYRGEFHVVLGKAVTVCLECIGLG